MACQICYDDFEINKIKTTKCNHTFCKCCYNKWMETHNTCPMCRKIIFKVKTIDELNNECDMWAQNKYGEIIEEMFDNTDECLSNIDEEYGCDLKIRRKCVRNLFHILQQFESNFKKYVLISEYTSNYIDIEYLYDYTILDSILYEYKYVFQMICLNSFMLYLKKITSKFYNCFDVFNYKII